MKKESPEEKLLKAIYGEVKKEEPEHCRYCGKIVTSSIYYNGGPYHPSCLGLEMNR